jgi:hemerythrin-like domain-containing protein
MSTTPQLLMVHDVDRAPPELLADPLAYLFAEHWRHRQYCRALGEAAALPAGPPALLRRLADFLGADMVLHVRDEEEDLFPLLRQRAEPEDDIGRVLGVLSADHDADRALARDVRTQLMAAAETGAGPASWPGLANKIGRLVTHKLQHIALENAVVLPIARLRFTPEDQQAMSRTMTTRRAE